MNIFLVGGAVRDKLLQLPVKEKDWVVVGSSPKELQSLGYQPVGKHFPVFLHPESKEEYALARKETKVAPGYTGFEFNTDESVTLEEDLYRRDLTINAIAETPEGKLIDPYSGQTDIENRVLRHISDAFKEDPVRVLRLARFAARFKPQGFSIAPETLELVKEMVSNGETDALVAERVWQEFSNALTSGNPEVFIETLEATSASQSILGKKFNCEAASQALQVCAKHYDNTEVRFACTVYNLGKDIEGFCKQLTVPNNYTDLAVLVEKHLSSFIEITQLRPDETLKLLKSCDAYRKPERFELFLQACDVLCLAQTQREDWPRPQAQYLRNARFVSGKISAKNLSNTKLKGKAIAEAIDDKRRAEIFQTKRTYRWASF